MRAEWLRLLVRLSLTLVDTLMAANWLRCEGDYYVLSQWRIYPLSCCEVLQSATNCQVNRRAWPKCDTDSRASQVPRIPKIVRSHS